MGFSEVTEQRSGKGLLHVSHVCGQVGPGQSPPSLPAWFPFHCGCGCLYLPVSIAARWWHFGIVNPYIQLDPRRVACLSSEKEVLERMRCLISAVGGGGLKNGWGRG